MRFDDDRGKDRGGRTRNSDRGDRPPENFERISDSRSREEFERGFPERRRHREGDDRAGSGDDFGGEPGAEFPDAERRAQSRREPRGDSLRRSARPEVIADRDDAMHRDFENHEWGRTDEDRIRQNRDDRERWLDEMEWRRSRRGR